MTPDEANGMGNGWLGAAKERDLRAKLLAGGAARIIRPVPASDASSPNSGLHRTQYAQGLTDADRLLLKARGIAADG